jgi:hypothetical protein
LDSNTLHVFLIIGINRSKRQKPRFFTSMGRIDRMNTQIFFGFHPVHPDYRCSFFLSFYNFSALVGFGMKCGMGGPPMSVFSHGQAARATGNSTRSRQERIFLTLNYQYRIFAAP